VFPVRGDPGQQVGVIVKRIFDILVSFLGLLITAPILAPVMVLIWRQDYHSPFYIADRAGRGGGRFRMVKLRSMVVNADKSGVDSTSANDNRITGVGRFVRNFKLDEISQLWNVLVGDMSLVGPRPNVLNETDRYTPVERQLLDVRPGMTDISSIVFSDEGEILENSDDPDLDYNRLIRPWKSELGLLYIAHQSLLLDIGLIVATALAVASKPNALKVIGFILKKINASDELRQIARREDILTPAAPPGADRPVIADDLYGDGAIA
jgi:lipopolysaccharide/colanic/teichoic acid biosynthesis glycosyltransferase